MRESFDVVILGCGEAGIFAAYELEKLNPGLKLLAIDQGPAKPAAFQIRSIFRQHLKFRIRNFGNFRAVAVMDSLFDRRIGMPHCPVAHQAVSAPLLRRYPRGLHRLFLPALRLFRLWFAF